MPSACLRTTDTTRSVMIAAKTGAAVIDDTARGGIVGGQVVHRGGPGRAELYQRPLRPGRLPCRASPSDSPDKITMPASSMPAWIIAGTCCALAATMNRY